MSWSVGVCIKLLILAHCKPNAWNWLYTIVLVAVINDETVSIGVVPVSHEPEFGHLWRGVWFLPTQYCCEVDVGNMKGNVCLGIHFSQVFNKTKENNVSNQNELVSSILSNKYVSIKQQTEP